MMKSSDVGKEINEQKLSELDAINLTEWLIFKIKIIYGRPVFEGDNEVEAVAIRQEWHDVVCKIGKKGVLATIDYILSGHYTVPSFPPSPIEFRKCYRGQVSPFLTKNYVTTRKEYLPRLTTVKQQDGYKTFQKFLNQLKQGYLEIKSDRQNEEGELINITRKESSNG